MAEDVDCLNLNVSAVSKDSRSELNNNKHNDRSTADARHKQIKCAMNDINGFCNEVSYLNVLKSDFKRISNKIKVYHCRINEKGSRFVTRQRSGTHLYNDKLKLSEKQDKDGKDMIYSQPNKKANARKNKYIDKKEIIVDYGLGDNGRDKKRNEKILVPEGSSEVRKKLLNRPGLISPLLGKSTAQTKAQANVGLDLQEGQTLSEKSVIPKINLKRANSPTNFKAQCGLILAAIQSETKQRQKNMKFLKKMGMPLPAGKTLSEKEMIQTFIREHEKSYIINHKSFSSIDKKISTNSNRHGNYFNQRGRILKYGRKRDAVTKHLDNTRRLPGLNLECGKIQKVDRGTRTSHMQMYNVEWLKPVRKEGLLRKELKSHRKLSECQTISEKALVYRIETESARNVVTDLKNLLQEINLDIKRQSSKLVSNEKSILQSKESVKGQERMFPKETLINGRINLPSEIGSSTISHPQKNETKNNEFLSDDNVTEGLVNNLDREGLGKDTYIKILAETGMPIPKGRTVSEIELTKKIKYEIGLPATPKTSVEKVCLAKAYAAGIVSPLSNKSRGQRENILRRLILAGVPLPIGRSCSEKAMIKRIQNNCKKGKLMCNKKCLNIFEKESPTKYFESAEDEKLVHEELTTSIDHLDSGASASTTYNFMKKSKELEGGIQLLLLKNNAATINTNILQLRHVEKKVLDKAQTERETMNRENLTLAGAAPDGGPCQKKEKLRNLKFTRLKDLALSGKPLPEGKTASEKKLILKIRYETGLPPTPQTRLEKIKMANAYCAGLITPLEGKGYLQKRYILKKYVDADIPLPVGRTNSEKNLINMLKEGYDISPVSEKRLKFGLFTPLETKTSIQKEKIIRRLAKYGMPLPEGQTNSEKNIIKKIKKELGLPSLAELKAVKCCKSVDALSTNQSSSEEVPIHKYVSSQTNENSFADSGLHLPKRKTASEIMELIIKIRTESNSCPKTNCPSYTNDNAQVGNSTISLKHQSCKLGKIDSKNGIDIEITSPMENLPKNTIKLSHMLQVDIGLENKAENIHETHYDELSDFSYFNKTNITSNTRASKLNLREQPSYIEIKATKPELHLDTSQALDDMTNPRDVTVRTVFMDRYNEIKHNMLTNTYLEKSPDLKVANKNDLLETNDIDDDEYLEILQSSEDNESNNLSSTPDIASPGFINQIEGSFHSFTSSYSCRSFYDSIYGETDNVYYVHGTLAECIPNKCSEYRLERNISNHSNPPDPIPLLLISDAALPASINNDSDDSSYYHIRWKSSSESKLIPFDNVTFDSSDASDFSSDNISLRKSLRNSLITRKSSLNTSSTGIF